MYGQIAIDRSRMIFAWNVSMYHNQQVSDLTDEMIIKKIKKGDSKLYEMILERYSDKIFRYLYYYFNFSKNTAEEVVQEVFIQVYNKIDKFDTNQKFESWLYRLAHNHCVDWLRKNSKDENASLNLKNVENNSEFDYQLKDQISDKKNLKSDLDHKFKVDLINELLDNLELKYKDVILLSYFEGMSYEEVGEILNIPKNTVGTLLSRGKKRLKEIVDKDKTLFDALEFDL